MDKLHEVELRNVRPNPWRHLKRYPIDPQKVARLRESFRLTGFWPNIVARPVDGTGQVEIAYGHHRIIALREEYEPDYKIAVVLRELSDGRMLQMMAAENDEAYRTTPMIDEETVRAVVEYFVGRQGEQEAKRIETVGLRGTKSRRSEVIAEFLGWPEKRVRLALAQIAAIDKKQLDREAIAKLPTVKVASEFRVAMQGIKSSIGKSVPPETQRRIADTIVREGISSSEVKREIRRMMIEAGHQLPRHVERMISDVSPKLQEAVVALCSLIPYRDALQDEVYRVPMKVLRDACVALCAAVDEIFQQKDGEKPEAQT
jgi:nitrogen regulatory protein PII